MWFFCFWNQLRTRRYYDHLCRNSWWCQFCKTSIQCLYFKGITICKNKWISKQLRRRKAIIFMRQNVSVEIFICSNQIAIVSDNVGCDIKRHSSVILSSHSLRSFEAWFLWVWMSWYPAFFETSKGSHDLKYSSTNTWLWLVKLVFAKIHIGYSYSKFINPKIFHNLLESL